MQPNPRWTHSWGPERSEALPTEPYPRAQLPQGGNYAQPPFPQYPSPPPESFETRQGMQFNPQQFENRSNWMASGVSPTSLTGNSLQNDAVGSRPPRKRALIIGCNYPLSPNDRLRSCVNDAYALGHTLVANFGYSLDNIRLLVDEGGTPTQLFLSGTLSTLPETQLFPPTRQNIVKSIKWLVQDAQAHDKLFFHFSGHGTCSVDYYGEEKGGSNQCMMPTDYVESGVLVDDDINRFLIRPLPKDCTLHALVDCCHSGTIMDLQFLVEGNGWSNQGPTRHFKGTSGGVVFQFAACRDAQRAYEPDDGSVTCGAATAAFIGAIISSDRVTYREVLRIMEMQVKKATVSEGIWQRMKEIWKKPTQLVLGRQYQRPQLSASTNAIPLSDEIHI